MSWTYRVIRQSWIGLDGEMEEGYGVHEVYDLKDGSRSVTTEPVAPFGETLEGLRKDIGRFARALEQPVLDTSRVLSKSDEEG